MKLYNLTNNDENWKSLYKSIEDKNWEFMVKTIKKINDNKTFWDNANKSQVAEISYCCWYLYGYNVGYDDNDFYKEVRITLTGGYNCYLKRFKKDNNLTSLMGYMISVVDFPFEASEGMGLKFEEMGTQMMKDAYKNEPENPFIACLNARGRAKNKYSKDAREYLHRVFKGCDGLIDYFYGRLENY